MTLPAVPSSFRWLDVSQADLQVRVHDAAALECIPLAAVAPHLFTTRQLQLTTAAQAARAAEAIGARELAMAKQVHGAAVIEARAGVAPPESWPEGDILVSAVPDVAVGVRAADCVPLLLADRARPVVAAVHAGWRGTAARAAVVALEAMTRLHGTHPADVVAALGPSIGPCCYEVGPELVDAFAAAGFERHLIDRWFTLRPARRGAFHATAAAASDSLRLDVAGANRDQLILAGVPETQVYLSDLCTAMHLDVLTSYRVEKEKAGRIAGMIRPRG